jgi:magnesium chelatase subunit D
LDQELLVLALTGEPSEEDNRGSTLLSDRVAFAVHEPIEQSLSSDMFNLAQSLLPRVSIESEWIVGLCSACRDLGIVSLRAPVFAVSASRGLAALAGRIRVEEEDVVTAVRLVLAHRARQLPRESDTEPAPQPETDNLPPEKTESGVGQATEVILTAVKAALPPNVLASISEYGRSRTTARAAKGGGGNAVALQRGRVNGIMRARDLSRQKLSILDTLRAAAPWQILRRRSGEGRFVVLRDDLRVSRRKQRPRTTAIFAVDASGSTAFQRLAEAKGAVELLLSECYVRRDQVALVSFRGKSAEVLLPPSRSLERARRALTALAGGGGTPLSAALDQTFAIAQQVRRGKGRAIVILLTDGRANVTRSGEGDKTKAAKEASEAATLFADAKIETLVMDVANDPQDSARQIAELLSAQYMHLPRAAATDIAGPVRRVMGQRPQ